MTIQISRDELDVLYRTDFSAFIERSFRELNSTTEYLPNWHIDVIASELEKCRLGETTRLILNEPPRSLKSHCASIALTAWLLGHDPTSQIICVSYAQDFADKLASDCRTLMFSPWYARLFPNPRLASSRPALHELKTTAGGVRMATSVGGVLMGRGANYIIIDDPSKADEALSEALRNAVNSWYDHTLISRLNNKKTGRIVLVMQRLHENDLTGHVQTQGPWKIVRFPAIAEEDEAFSFQTVFGMQTHVRKVGEALHPEREPLETLAQIRQVQGEYHFAAQYQQSPAPLGGGMIKVDWFNTYSQANVPAEFDMTLQSWDTANKPGELNDFSVCTTWGIKEKKLFLLHVLRKRLNYPDLKRAVMEQAEAFSPQTILIEDKASGTQLIQDLIAERVYTVKAYESKLDKSMRLYSVSNVIENGLVYLPEKASWLVEYLHEISIFPNGKFDDMVDSTSQALDWIKQGNGSGWMETFAREHARCRREGLPWIDTLNSVNGASKPRKTRTEQCKRCQNRDLLRLNDDVICTKCKWKDRESWIIPGRTRA
jgi:predicted phage terminase large subunit-like protein